MTSRHRFSLLFLATVAPCLFLGCGDGRGARVPVSGTVTIDGEPVNFGSIAFLPVKTPGAATRAGAASLEDGRFSVSSYTPNDGLLQGKYEVMISAIEPLGEKAQRWHAPRKYSNSKTSGFSVEVTKGMEELKFDLSWEGEKQKEPFVEKF